ncbi:MULTISPECIES: methyltransferase [unclassified Frankia]|uniref:methyltransferase n=1 Tax=unclassified Frankia TaxID=2632575 RepID=UPI000AE0143B|nr:MULTISPECIES: methyltransferase [unclassified Frankia]
MFYDPVEYTFYAWCVERLLSSASVAPYLRDGVVELGAGSGLPIVEALRRCEMPVQARGFERDPESFRIASRLAALKAPPGYSVEPGDFFDRGLDGPERVAIANPPYLAAPTGKTSAPELWGGESGAEVTCRMLSGPFDVLMLMMASIADPVGVIDHAARSGYLVVDWCARPNRCPIGSVVCLDTRRVGRAATWRPMCRPHRARTVHQRSGLIPRRVGGSEHSPPRRWWETWFGSNCSAMAMPAT